ncbi:hypothetical protein HYU92_02545 [Candidatus Curtissbacteria bacterium]|nr:hypothetical protein [Candidatus Curtissbacteria bacterium]
MKPVKQEDSLGCGVACMAFILGINYQNSLNFFKDGRKKANKAGFFCREIVMALEKAGLRYEYKYIKPKIKKKIYKPNTIVFLRRSKKYPSGHYLCRADNKWMDPWINFPVEEKKAGFRRSLPGKPIYAIFKHL